MGDLSVSQPPTSPAPRQKIIVTPAKARAAFILAIVVDLLQAPAQVATLSGVLALPTQAIDLGVDVVTALIMSRLLGFHWALAPTFLLEALPFVDVAPTWTACVWIVIQARKSEGRYEKMPKAAARR